MSDAKEAGKARVAARILLASDDASEAVISQADTAGAAVRLWRVQRGMDADVDALPEARQAELGRMLARGDADTRSAARRLDQDALDDLTRLDVGPRVRAGLAPKYAELDANRRAELGKIIRIKGDSAAAGGARLDDASLRTVIDADYTTRQRADVLETVDDANIHTLGETPDGRDLAVRYLTRSGGSDGDVLRANVCNSPCDSIADSVTGLDLSDDQEEYLLANLDAYDRRQSGHTRSVSDVESDLERLAREDVDGLREAIEHGTRNKNDPVEITHDDLSALQGLDGEVDAATNILDNERTVIKSLDNDIDTSKGTTDVDIDLEDGTGIEVKNRDYTEIPEYAKDSEIDELTTKMEKYAEVRDDIVIATKGDPQSSDVLQSVKENIESDYPDAEIQIMHIDDLDSL